MSWLGSILEANNELEIRYRHPDQLLIATVEGIEISIRMRASASRISQAKREMTIGEGTQIKLSFDKPKLYDECIKIIYRVANFFCLAAKKPVYPLAIVGVTKDDQDVDILYEEEHAQTGLGPQISDQMVFALKDVEGRIDDLLKNWFKKASEIEPILDLYFGTLYNPKLYPNHKFLNLVQALEAYHRRTMKNYMDKPEDHEIRLKEIYESISNVKYRKWLEKKLTHSNEPFLVIRLSQLIKKFKEILKWHLGDWDSLPKKVTDTRNYLTHFDPSKEASAAKGDDLLTLTKQLRLLLELVLLNEIGFSLDEMSFLRVGMS